jgi:ATP-dependent Lhr-like helicase
VTTDVRALLGPLAAGWFESAFAEPTPAQAGAWAAIARGDDTVVIAPTGSGKTLAAFLHALDRLAAEPPPADPAHRCRVLYVSPLKALAVDVERNLRSPLAGMANEALRLGVEPPDLTVGIRTGDTPQAERSRMARRPPDILITTPESLYLLLTAQGRECLRGVNTVIVDEVHVLAGSKRGAHLAVSLERLDHLLDSPAQRIGLSATVNPPETVATWLRPSRPATIIAPAHRKEWDLQVRVPVDDMSALGTETVHTGSAAASTPRTSLWPHIEEDLVDLVEQHESTLVFVNSRRLAERLTARINDISVERAAGITTPSDVSPLARAHHGSVSKEQRSLIEDDLKAGRLPAVVATSSLELGIDMGAIDLVVQVETPPSVASGLQRVGRAGHQVGAVSRGIVFPKFRGDLVTAAVVTSRMKQGLLESSRIPTNPLDVLAQQIVAMVAMDNWSTTELLDLVRRSAAFATLSETVFESVLDMLSGRYPSDEFAELRPRMVWDRESDQLRARPGAQRLAVTSGGTIPDRGLFGVFLVGGDPAKGGTRVGELDEEMVYESRVGDVIALGASSWRIEEITHDRVLVTPAPGEPGRLPFWHGDSLGRPAELGRAVGAFIRAVDADADAALALSGLDDRARTNLLAYLSEQRSATSVVPSDTDIVVERFRDELGDWRIVIHSPLGSPVHAPWALLLGARLQEATGLDPQVMHADDGIVLRLPDTDDDGGDWDIPSLLATEPADLDRQITDLIGGSALFASRFRECAARALLLPRRRPGRRTPLWQQRQRSAHLLDVAAQHASFPIVLETVRECLQDVYDVPALRHVLEQLHDGSIRVHDIVTDTPSPFAQSLLYSYVAAFLYEGDAPLAERRARALTVDPVLLAELLGSPELRDLLDADALAEVEAEVQRRDERSRARHREDAADLLRVLGPLSDAEARACGVDPAWLSELIDQRRAFPARIAGASVTAAVEDAGRLRDALGIVLPPGIPAAHLDPGPDPVGDLVSRYARTHGPFTVDDASTAIGLPPGVVRATVDQLHQRGRLARGEFRPVGAGGSPTQIEYCDPDVLRRVRRRSIARLRHQAEPVAPEAFAEFLPQWQSVAPVGRRPARAGADACFDVIDQLAGLALPASEWLTSALIDRVDGAAGHSIDILLANGDIRWWGHAPLAGGDGLVCLAPADRVPDLLPPASDTISDAARRVLDVLLDAGALFFRDVADRAGVGASGALLPSDGALLDALWELVWAGHITNDGWACLRARVSGARTSAPRRSTRRPHLPQRSGPPAGAGRWSALPPAVDPTSAGAAQAQALLDRYGIVTRGSVAAERVPGGFARTYRVLTALEDAGRCQRMYAVEGLGAAQFTVPTAVDRLRAAAVRPRTEPVVHVLAATDPANAYGAALPWPASESGRHRPGRKPGALVVLVDGALVLFLEKGGRSLLTWAGEDPDVLPLALHALGIHAPRLGRDRFVVDRVDGTPLDDSQRTRLAAAGFLPTPRGMRAPVPSERTPSAQAGNGRAARTRTVP